MEKRSILTNSRKSRAFQKLNRRELAIAILFLIALLAGLWLPARLIVSTSASLNHRIFIRTSCNKSTIKDGDYLVFKQSHSPFVHLQTDKEDLLFIKQVGCSQGEVLKRDNNNQFFCGKKLMGKALAQDSEGRSLPQFRFNGLIPDHHYFMLGTHPRSFDSKYIGFIHADEIIHKALPLW